MYVGRLLATGDTRHYELKFRGQFKSETFTVPSPDGILQSWKIAQLHSPPLKHFSTTGNRIYPA